jgi:nucleotide-binding universal stress UspA family protein
MKHILVTTDFSEAAESAFDYAKEQVQLIGKEKCRITLLKAIDVAASANINFEYGLAIADKKSMLNKSHKQASEIIKGIAQEHFAGFSVETLVLKPSGPVYMEIIKYAKKQKVDLIVISTHGRTGIKHLFLGSVAERIIRQSPCPVMVVPAKL